ncbi:abscission/NoCut checkpoint regulator isoform X1 [Dendroctonus ponderosae]|uniref:abscission/NoCut checkpoint regulator isoform X1 n=1 Tax=Dendroctonus ponderosae TaxID=77166 RepID=UPI002034C5DE|nr:abscission/NoCut checkpoint regulator isoform X1 [Dendroctonus ponderosae]
MSCNHCNTKYNFFHKEVLTITLQLNISCNFYLETSGCALCGLSLCSKCLQQKCQIPSKGQGEFKVCRTCYAKLNTQSDDKENTLIPPDRFFKRLENLENPAAPPITVYREDPKMSALKNGLSVTDKELVDRLEKLKEKQPLPPSDSELRERLARLKDSPFESSSNATKPLFMPDMRTDQEKADALLEQYTFEQAIGSLHQNHEDLSQRLAALKGEELKSLPKERTSSDSDSENEVERITKRMVAELSLERCPVGGSKMTFPHDDYDDEDYDYVRSSPELPWCVLCNNDATMKCYDCGGDLYCNSCNVEVHKKGGDLDHRVEPYKKK